MTDAYTPVDVLSPNTIRLGQTSYINYLPDAMLKRIKDALCSHLFTMMLSAVWSFFHRQQCKEMTESSGGNK